MAYNKWFSEILRGIKNKRIQCLDPLQARKIRFFFMIWPHQKSLTGSNMKIVLVVSLLTGTWLGRGKLPAGLFFLLLLLLLVPPPALMVLPPEILRFRRLLGACRAGSAEEKRTIQSFMMWKVQEVFQHSRPTVLNKCLEQASKCKYKYRLLCWGTVQVPTVLHYLKA